MLGVWELMEEEEVKFWNNAFFCSFSPIPVNSARPACSV